MVEIKGCDPCTSGEERRKERNLYFAISDRWYTSWQKYVGLQTEDISSGELTKAGATVNNYIIDSETGDPQLRKKLVEGVDYVLFSEQVWRKLVEWYKGGPQCTLGEERLTELTSLANANLKERNLCFAISNRLYTSWKIYVGLLTEDLPSREAESETDAGLHKKLGEGVDYVLVSEQVWRKLVERYKGGPQLICEDKGIHCLPDELILQIILRLPKRNDPVLSCVCTKFHQLVSSNELTRLRRTLKEDWILVSFIDMVSNKRFWFTVSRIEGPQHQFLSQELPDVNHIRSVTASGSMIYMVSGTQIEPTLVWSYNWLTRTLDECPSMPVEVVYKTASMVGQKLYITGWKPNGFNINRSELYSHAFNINSKRWESTPVFVEPFVDGICSKTRLIATGNILVGYSLEIGLMWYDESHNQWENVFDFIPLKARSVVISEYNGKLGILWTMLGDENGMTKKLYLTTLALKKTKGGITGVADPYMILGEIPQRFEFRFCVSFSG
ncbi:unnamed protein product [Arabidopsis halleri]